VGTWNTNMSNITIQRNTVNGTGAEAIGFYMGRTDLGATAKELTTAYIGYNTITNMGQSGSLGIGIIVNNKVTGAIVEHNNIRLGTGSATSGIAVSSNEVSLGYYPTNVIIRYNDVSIVAPCLYIQQGQAKSVTAYYNKFYSTGSAYSGVIYTEQSSSPSYAGAVLNFYNNVLVTAGITTSCLNDNTDVSGVCTFKNNICINTATSGFGCININTLGSTVHTNNSYYRNQPGDLYYAIVNNPYTEYKRSTAQSFEASSTITDPSLYNVLGGDWTLRSNSPCINAGAYIPSIPQVDFIGNAVNNPPEIGAYEYNTSTNAVAPTVTTTAITSITNTTAYSGGNVTSDGSASVTSRGVCWSINTNPSIGLSTKTSDGTGTGSYASYMTGLSASTNYWVRAYATNSVDTSYGANIQFSTTNVSTSAVSPHFYRASNNTLYTYQGKFLF